MSHVKAGKRNISSMNSVQRDSFVPAALERGLGSSRAILTEFSTSLDVNQPTAVLFRHVSTWLNCLLFQSLCLYGTSLDSSGIHCIAHYGHLPHLSPQGIEFANICRDIISYKVGVAAKWIQAPLCVPFFNSGYLFGLTWNGRLSAIVLNVG